MESDQASHNGLKSYKAERAFVSYKLRPRHGGGIPVGTMVDVYKDLIHSSKVFRSR